MQTDRETDFGAFSSFGLPWKVISELVVIPEARPLSKIGLLVARIR